MKFKSGTKSFDYFTNAVGRSRKQSMKKRKTEQIKDDETSRLERVSIIIFIILCLLYLVLTGGNNQSWYPGKPFNER